MRFLSVLVLSYLAGLGGAQETPRPAPAPVPAPAPAPADTPKPLPKQGAIYCKVAPWVCIFIRVLKALPAMIIIDVGHGQAPPGNCHDWERTECITRCGMCTIENESSFHGAGCKKNIKNALGDD
ncbi:hypothetical protein KJE20_07216 [Pyrenophora tritici-repentis]|nr:hypothetical protein KJE20_07216 [Pyrenophora tritici-repentis]